MSVRLSLVHSDRLNSTHLNWVWTA